MTEPAYFEWLHVCTGCKLRWILFSERKLPDRSCPFCKCPLVKPRLADRG